MVKKITQSDFEKSIKEGVALVDFSASWCGPCQMLVPIIEEISEEMNGKMNFFKVDVDVDSSLAVKYGISNIPALLVTKNGEKQDIIVGFRPKEQLIEELKKYL